MPAGSVAGWIRGRALLQRRLGPDGARRLAEAGDGAEAVAQLAATAYGHGVEAGMDLAAAQRGVAATLLWNLRVLAGWQPPGGISPLRALAGGFEIANTVDLLLVLAGRSRPAPFELGSLSTAWREVRSAGSPAAVRETLARSDWGDPGTTDPAAVLVALRFSWARRVADEVPAAGGWARRAAQLMLADLRANGAESLVAPRTQLEIERVLGPGRSVEDRGRAPGTGPGKRPLPGGPERLGSGGAAGGGSEEAWAAWRRLVGGQAAAMAAASRPGPEPTVGFIGLLAADAWRVRAALAAAGAAPGRGWEDLTGAVA